MRSNLSLAEAEQIALKILGLIIATRMASMLAVWLVFLPATEARTAAVLLQVVAITSYQFVVIWLLLRQTTLSAAICFGKSSQDTTWNPNLLSFWIIVISIYFLLDSIPSFVVSVIYYAMGNDAAASVILRGPLTILIMALVFFVASRITHRSSNTTAPLTA